MRAINIKLFLFLALTVTSLNLSAQSRQLRKTDSVLRLIKKYVRTKDADSIYNLGSAVYQGSISADAFRNTLFQYLFPLGEIKKDSLVSFVNNVTANYKIQFKDRDVLFILGLSPDYKIDQFWFGEYKKDPGNKPYTVSASNLLQSVTDAKIDSAARLYIQKANTVGLSVGIIKDGKISAYNYGETAKGNDQLPADNTIFEISSITKTFTSTLLAYYVNEGKVSLSDPITKFLPDSVAANPELKGITLLNLSNHTSELPRIPGNMDTQKNYEPLDPYKNYTDALLFSYLKSCKLKSKPGEKFEYSNLGAGLLGVILEKISGKKYEQMVTEIICKPLGMKNTVQHLSPATSPRFAAVYNEDGNQTPAWDYDAMAGGGSLRSTVNDLLIYTEANMVKGASKLSKAMQLAHQVTFSSDVKIGLAWHIIRVNGISYYYHNGGSYGSSSFLAYNAERNVAVVLLSNSGASTDMLGEGILEILQ
jgi:CubicO group peptidase (beta-lactamase class C family)